VNVDGAELRDFAARYTAAWRSQDAGRVALVLLPRRLAPEQAAENSFESRKGYKLKHVPHGWSIVCKSSGACFSLPREGPGGAGCRVLFSGLEECEIGPNGLIAASLGHFDEADYRRQLQTSSLGTALS